MMRGNPFRESGKRKMQLKSSRKRLPSQVSESSGADGAWLVPRTDLALEKHCATFKLCNCGISNPEDPTDDLA